MEANHLIQQIQNKYKGKLLLAGLAALQYPTVQTQQLTFFNPSGDKKDYHIGPYHVFIRRVPKKSLETMDHLLFIAKHIEFYASELKLLIPILTDVSLKDLERHDRAWRIFAYLKKYLLQESIRPKKVIGRRTIDIGDIQSPNTIKDKTLHIRDALLVPSYVGKIFWQPKISQPANLAYVEQTLKESWKYFESKDVRPLFHKFARYASRLESAASAKIEGYDAHVDAESLSLRLQKRIKENIDLQAHLNMDNLHRDLINLSREPLTLDLLLSVQKAIVKNTWKDEMEKIDKTPGELRPFDVVIVNRGRIDVDNVIFIAPKASDVKTLLHELIDFYYSSRNIMHPLDLAAIFKCQLVILHPFGDGNGRLARWFFLYILVRENILQSAYQAPISHIFLQEKNRYYNQILKVDLPVMQKVTCEIDPQTHRYHALYEDINVYRQLDYSTWLAYSHDAFVRALNFSMEEHKIFERSQGIYYSFLKELNSEITTNQQHNVLRAIDIGLRKEWGRKTEKRLYNNGFSEENVEILKVLIDSRI